MKKRLLSVLCILSLFLVWALPAGVYAAPNEPEKPPSSTSHNDDEWITEGVSGIRVDNADEALALLTGGTQKGRRAFGPSPPAPEYTLKDRPVDKAGQGKSYQFQQTYHGIPIYGMVRIVNTDTKGYVQAISGDDDTAVAEMNLPTKPVLTGADAVRIGLQTLDLTEYELVLTESELCYYAAIYKDAKNLYHLAYRAEVSGFDTEIGAFYYAFMVDAQNGRVLKRSNILKHWVYGGSGYGVLGDYKTFKVYRGSGSTKEELLDFQRHIEVTDMQNSYDDTKWGITSKDSNNQWYDPRQGAEVDAYVYLQNTYDYFYDTLGWQSFDNDRAYIYGCTHYGWYECNAFWNGLGFYFGDGDEYGRIALALSGAPDVVAHEFTHAVTDHTAELEYDSIYGALNEAFSDIFGALAEDAPDDTSFYRIGERVWRDGPAVRDMGNPRQYGMPGTMSQYQHIGEEDLGGVHVNCAIPCKAFHTMGQSLSRDQLAHIWFSALRDYLTQYSDFWDARAATIQAATAMYDASAASVVASAWDSAGVTAADPDVHGDTLDQGTQYVYGDTVSGTINWAGDLDCFVFTPTAGGTYDFYTSGRTDTLGAIMDAEGEIIAIDDDGGSRQNFRVSASLQKYNTYYVVIRHYNDYGHGSYTLQSSAVIDPVTSLSATFAPSSAGEIQKQVIIQANAGPERAEYQFQVKSNRSSRWSTLQSYRQNNRVAWTPQPPGTYDIRVRARSVGRTSAYDIERQYAYEALDIPPLTGVELETDGETIRENGTLITVTAIPGGAESETSRAQYQFRLKQGRRWKTVQTWSDDPIYEWTPEGTGAYTLEVQARTQGRSGIDTSAAEDFEIVYPDALEGVELSADPGVSSEKNTDIVLTAAASGEQKERAEYLFRVKRGRRWSTLRDWSPQSTYTWSPAINGAYQIEVQARTKGRPAVDQSAGTDFTVVDIYPLEEITLLSSKPGMQPAGTEIRLSAFAQGPHADESEYAFQYSTDGRRWRSIGTWTNSPSALYTPESDAVYQFRVQARSAGRSGVDVVDTISQRFYKGPMPIEGVFLWPAPMYSQETGASVKLECPAQGEAGGDAEYRFLVKRGRRWATLRDWDSAYRYDWVPDRPGNYTIEVQARAKGRSGIDAAADWAYTIVDVFPLTGVTLHGAPSGMQEAGTEINLEAEAEGPHADTAEYAFQYSTDGRRWRTFQGFGETAATAYTPDREAEYQFRVQAKSAGRKGVDAQDTFSQQFYTGAMPVEGVSLEIAPQDTQEIGRTVVINASAHGDAAEDAEYLYRVKLGRRWSIIRDWDTNPAYEWTPERTGAYTVEVQARTRGRKGTDAIDAMDGYTITLPPPLDDVIVSADRESPQEIGAPIILTAQAQGAQSETDRAEYLFRVKLGRRWSTLQNWSGNGICLWEPDRTGTYTIEVQARTEGRPGTDVTSVIDKYEITLPPELTEVELYASEDSPQETGTSIELNAVAQGAGSEISRAQYLFRVKLGRRWSTLQNWSGEDTCIWEPDRTGTYTIEVQARTEGRPGADVTATVTYTIMKIVPVSSVTLSPEPENCGVVDEPTTVTAAADRPLAEYRFHVRQGDGPYEWLQDWSEESACVWTPDAPDQYTLLVMSRARQQNAVQAIETLSYRVLALPPVKAVAIETDPQKSCELGDTVEIAGQADQPDAEYQFAYSRDGSMYTVVQDFSTDAACTWQPDAVGVYSWRVRARTDASFPLGQAEGLIEYGVYTEVNIPDAALRAGLLGVLGKAPDDSITSLDMAALTSLDCSGWGIEDLTGIEYAVNIVDLDLSGNRIADLAPLQTLIDNGGLTALESHLDITSNGLDTREETSAKAMIDAWTGAGVAVAYLPQHPVVGSVTLAPDTDSPGDAGAAICLIAQADQPGVEYRFTVNDTLLADWTDDHTVDWMPDTVGIHTLTVQARTWGMPETEVTDDIQYEIIPAPLSSVSIGAEPGSPIQQGNPVTLSAVGEAGAWYRFQLMREGEDWISLGDWSQATTAEWIPQSAGNVTVRVQAHRDGRPADRVDTQASLEYRVVPNPLTGNLQMNVSPESPQSVGTEIAIHVNDLGPDAQYWYGVQNPEGEWIWTEEWSTRMSAPWTPDTPGIYLVYARARAAGRDGFDLEDAAELAIAPPPIGAVSLSADPESPQAAGTEITLTAATEGSNPQYCFSVKQGEEAFEDIQEWSESNTCTWMPDASGTYTLRVQGREWGQTVATAEDALIYQIAWPAIETLAIDIDEEITYQHQTRQVSATANTDHAQFKFSVQNPDDSWHTLQDWSENAECQWVPSAAGDYVLQVDGRGLGRIGSDRSETMTVSVYPSPPVREWSAYYGGSGSDEAKAVQQTSDGGFILAGYTRSTDIPGYRDPNGLSDGYLVKTDSMGNMQWQFCRGGDRSDWFCDVAQTDDGGFLAVGRKGFGSNTYVYVVKVSPQGHFEWENAYPGSGSNNAYSIIRTRDGNYCVAGYVCDTGFAELSGLAIKKIATGTDGFVLKIDGSGEPLWLKYYGGNDGDYLYDIAEASDGSLVCVGKTRSTNLNNNYHGGTDGWVVKTGSSGAVQWQRAIGGGSQDCFYGVCTRYAGGQERYEMVGSTQSNDGDVSGRHGYNDGYFVSISASGDTLYKTLCLGGSGDDLLNDIISTEDKGLLLLGGSNSKDGDFANILGAGIGWMMRMDSQMQLLWQKRLYEVTSTAPQVSICEVNDGFVLSGCYDNTNQVYGPLAQRNSVLTKMSPEGVVMPFYAGMSFDRQSPQGVGTSITVHGLSNLDGVEYRFLCYDEAGTEIVLQDWGTDQSAPWAPAAAGMYMIKTQARMPAYPQYVETDIMQFDIE